MATYGFFSEFFDLFCCKPTRQMRIEYRKSLRFSENFRNNKQILSLEIARIKTIQKSPFGAIEVFFKKQQFLDLF